MKNKLIMIIILILVCLIFFSKDIFAASMGLSISNTSCYIDDTFTVTISGINGRVNVTGNSNVTLSLSGSQWVDGSLSITGTAKAEGTGTITVTPVDVTTNSAEPEEVTTPASVSIKISKKEIPEPTQVPTETPKQEQIQPQTSTQAQTTKKNNTTKNKVTEKSETKNKEEQGTVSEFGITSLYLYAINENSEKEELVLSPKFDINTSEYTCDVESNIKNVEVIYEANEYKELVKITGLENELKTGENIIEINMKDNKGQEKIYKIIVNKKEEDIEKNKQEEIVQENAEKTNEKAMIKMPVITFVFLEIGVVIFSIVIFMIILRLNKIKLTKQNRNKLNRK